jgi:hypothetical protein
MCETITFNGSGQCLDDLLKGHYALNRDYKITIQVAAATAAVTIGNSAAQLFTLDCDAGESFAEFTTVCKIDDLYIKGTNSETAVALIENP